MVVGCSGESVAFVLSPISEVASPSAPRVSVETCGMFSAAVLLLIQLCVGAVFFFNLNTEHKDVRLVTLCTQLLGQMLVWNLVLVKLDSGPKARTGHNIVVKESYHCFCACERWANSELHVPECPV